MGKSIEVRRANSIIKVTTNEDGSVTHKEVARFTKGMWYKMTLSGDVRELEAVLPEQAAEYAKIKQDSWCFNSHCAGCPLYLECSK